MNATPKGYKVIEFQSDDPVWELSPDEMKKFNLAENQSVTLKFGCLSTCVKVISKKLSYGVKLRMSNQVLQELRMPVNIKVSIKPSGEQEFRLGPVIGLLTFHHVVASKHLNFFLNYAIQLKSGLLYVFSYKGINPKTRTIKGYYYNFSKKTWDLCEFPYPDAVMDQCYPNAYRAHYHIEKALGKGKIFNKKTMINKLNFYKALSKHNLLINHLPETKALTGTADIEYFLNTYRNIFLKPVHGMKGNGIITVSQKKNDLKCQYMAKGKKIEKKLTNPNEVFDVIKDLYRVKIPYVIQEAIPRMKYLGRPFSFRVIVSKNGSGQWLVPAIFPKAAAGDCFLTNHAAGAGFVPLKKLFGEITNQLPYTKKEFIDLLIDLAVETARALDQKYGPLGELGIDIVTDRSGKPWLIEANGNPGFVPWSHTIEFPDWRHQVFQLPVSYAIYLAGFND